jgi:type 1 fimbriae regulatory protein FimB/type 1 fimbriae regulatory protein FimE
LVAYRHALRSSELVTLRWDDVDFTTSRLHVRRAKSGETAVHPISGKELRALRRLQRESERSTYIFVSERGAPLSVAGYQRMVARAGAAAGFSFLIHSHMLRHSCGYKLANDGHDTRAIQGYLGHRSIVSTHRYTASGKTDLRWRRARNGPGMRVCPEGAELPTLTGEAFLARGQHVEPIGG